MRQRFATTGHGALAASCGFQAVFAVWLQPDLAQANGGVVFFIAYLISLVVVVLPVAWLELGLGSGFQVSLPFAIRRAARIGTVIGWWSHGLVALLTAIAVLTVAWILVQVTATVVALVVGSGGLVQVWPGATPVTSVSTSALLLGAVLLMLLGLWSLRSGLRQWCGVQVWTVGAGLGLGLVALVAILIDPVGRAGVAQVCRMDSAAWGAWATWRTAMVAALGTAGVGLGGLTLVASWQRRDADAGRLALVSLSGGGLIHVLVGLLAAGIHGGLASSGIGGFWVTEGGASPATALALVALAALVTSGVVLGPALLRAAWRDATGLFSRVVLHRILMVIALIAGLLLATGPWVISNLVRGLGLVVIPGLVGVLALLVALRPGSTALRDHLRAYSSCYPPIAWRWWLGGLVPIAVLVGVVGHLLDHPSELMMAVIPLALVVPAVFWTWRWSQDRIRRHLVVVALLTVVGWAGAAAVSIAQRAPVRALHRDLEQQHYRLISRGVPVAVTDIRSPVYLAREAWRHGMVAETAVLVRALQQVPRSEDEDTALQVWSEQATLAALAEVNRRGGDRSQVFRNLHLLRAIGQTDHIASVTTAINKSDWFPDALLAPWRRSIRQLQLAEQGREQLGWMVWQRWLTLAAFVAEDIEPLVLLDGPEKVAKPAKAAQEALAAWLAVAGPEVDALRSACANAGVIEPASPIEPQRSFPLGGLATLLLALAALAVAWLRLVMTGLGSRPDIDPQAETLENVELTDIDTEAVTIEGGTDSAMLSDCTTPVDLDTDGL